MVYGSILQPYYDPAHSDLNMILIVADDCNINNIRRIFLPLWGEHHTIYRRAPLVARESTFTRYLNIFPAFHNHLNDFARIIKQNKLQNQPLSTAAPHETRAHLAREALVASTILAQEGYDKSKREKAVATLNRLQRRYDLLDEAGLPQLLCEFLNQISNPTPNLKAEDDAPYHIVGLVSLYEKLGDLIFIVETPATIPQIDWTQVADDVATNGFTGFSITTPELFRLLVEKVYPLDHAILSYNHVWGADLLTAVTVPAEDVMRDAARIAMIYEVDQYPNRLLTTPPSQENNAVVIHDFQNKLLNIRLQNELLARLKMSDKSGTGRLPGKDAAQIVRLQGLWEIFGLWGQYFYDIYRTGFL